MDSSAQSSISGIRTDAPRAVNSLAEKDYYIRRWHLRDCLIVALESNYSVIELNALLLCGGERRAMKNIVRNFGSPSFLPKGLGGMKEESENFMITIIYLVKQTDHL
ncbi:hypothetical protein TNCV_4993041 [Trichonephila clavipes]|nr:hypothetical protein TNCV_4993041 [Trichonephila clavipes]